jgi:TonB-dependent starch-binding outer membrane protein SusC
MTIHGQVLDASGNGIPNATIRNINRQKATMSDNDGYFSLYVGSNDTIEVSSIGYGTLQMSSDDLYFYDGNVQLQIDAQVLPGVVVISKKLITVKSFLTIAIVLLVVMIATKYVK